MLRVKLFGTGRVLDGDTETKLRSRNWTLPLLAYVVLHRSEIIPRSRLAFTIWPDETEEAALQNLRRNLHLLVKALPGESGGEPHLRIDADAIAWNNAADVQIDVAEYERLRADPSTLEQAVALYEGDLLEEIYDDWVSAERERLRRLYHADLTALIVANRAQRRFGKAIRWAQELLTADPWREDTLRSLMSVRYESGDAAGALAEFDRFARLLAAELSAQPMPETLALRETIARGGPIPGASDVPKAPVRRVPPATPFVGRERELEQLRAHWNRAAAGSGILVLVRGDAGIGKSRLVSELALIVEAEGGRVIEGTTSSPEREPYECVAEALRQGLAMIAALPVAPHVMAVVAELVPELRARLADLPTPPRLDERSERERLFSAVSQVLVSLARPRPLLVLFEDVQWADAATLELIRLLSQRISGSPVFLLATCREERVALPPALRSVARVMLGPLDAAAVAALAAIIAPDGSTEAGFAQTVFERSGGNPLFATEMLRDAARGAYDAAAIPESIAAMIASRVEPLDRTTQTLAQVAAVAGAAFAFDVVRDATGFADAAVLAGLGELLDRHLIRESTERGRYEYAFTHDLVRQALYHAMPSEVRARRHLRVGRVLENAYAHEAVKPAAEIAVHYDRGGDAPAAAQWYLLAAQRAASLYANAEARDFASRALQLEPRDGRSRFDLLLLRQEMNGRLGENDARLVDLEQLATLAPKLDENAKLKVLQLEADVAHDHGGIAGELEACARFRRRAEAFGDTAWLAVAMLRQAKVQVRAEHLEGAVTTALAARAQYLQLGDVRGEAESLMYASGACTLSARSELALEFAEGVRAIAERTGDQWIRGFALGALVAQSDEVQKYARTAEYAREQLQLSTSFGLPVIQCVAHSNLAGALRNLWRVEEALVHFRDYIALREATSFVYGAAGENEFALFLGELGDFQASLTMFERAESVASRVGRSAHLLEIANERAYVCWQHAAIDEMRGAVAEAAKFVGELTRSRAACAYAVNRARLLRHDARFDEAAALALTAAADYRRIYRPLDEIVATEELAETHLAAGSIEEALAALEQSRKLIAQLEDPSAQRNPVAHHWIAHRIYRAAGDHASASVALSAARDAYERRRDAIGDASLRGCFEAMPLHRAVREAAP